MNFIKFPVASTNIFPIANSTDGGQLVTEFNLRSRESVYTNPSVQYFIGPSYTHSVDDFKVDVLQGSANYFSDSVAASSQVLQIAPGRALVNGHYVESLVTITIDMVEAAASVPSGSTPLKGNLSVGLRAMYSTEVTLDGSILTVDNNDLYEGIQVVILPTEEFVLPKDSPDDATAVKAHLLLATFNYNNGVISSVTNNPAKCEMVDISRIGDIDGTLSKHFPSKDGLNPKMFYTMAGKYYPSSNPDESYWSAEWCNSTDAIMKWDGNVHIATSAAEITAAQTYSAAQFVQGGKTVSLVVPHKQIDGMASSNEFFAPVVLPIPVADFETGAPGVVDSTYSANIKRISDNFEKIYTLASGKQKHYIPELFDRNYLPSVDMNWEEGDYILVGQDDTLDYTLPDPSRKPSTIYVILPGTVYRIEYFGTQLPSSAEHGIELGRIDDDTTTPNTTDYAVYSTYWTLDKYRGVPLRDYFVYKCGDTRYYYVVTMVGPNAYSDPVLVTGGVPLAGTDVIGGFLNSPDTAVDDGYVYVDNKGYLRLRDYQLLRSGTLAYQLGEDYTVPGGLELDAIQAYLNEYVNQRVAFPNNNQIANSEPNRININIELSTADEGEITLFDIDSRFNTCICLHIKAADGVIPKATINIADCQKVQLDTAITTLDNVKVNIYRSSVYYNADVFNYVNSMQDITIWYERFSSNDPVLSVEGMTVTQMMYNGLYQTNNLDTISDWSNINVNDYHFSVALQSLTFSADGYVNGVGILIKNASTSNVQYGKNIISDTFTLPQGPNLMYPADKMNRPIKVTGDFIVGYTDSSNNMTIMDTNFSLMTQYISSGAMHDGNIAICIDASRVPVSSNLNPPEWDANSFHYFSGKIAL